MTIWLIILILVALAMAGAPLFTIIAAIGLIAFTATGMDTSAMMIELYRLVDMPALIAVPLFTFAGFVLAESKAPKRLLNLAQVIFGWMPGGLAIVALFPPSLPIILYSIIAAVNIDQLFLAGLIPGILLILILSLYGIRTGILAHVPRIPFSWKAVYLAFKEAVWEAPLPVVIIGGIYGGLFTATEAAAVTAAYVLIVEVFIHRELKLFSDLPRVIRESMILVGAILMMLGAALGVTNFLIDEQIPMKMFALISQYVSSKVIFLIILNIFILIMNMVEIFSAIIIVVPLIVPVALQYGINPVHLGIIFLLNLEIGYMTPPLGLNLFLSSLRFHKPLPEVYRTVLPFFLLLVLVLLLITYVPELSLMFVSTK
jgi:C4-dicarboxylate transporter DctM subunit